MVIDRALLDDVIAHAREEFDAECCGVIAYAEEDADERRAISVRRARNIHATHLRFEIGPKELLHIYTDFEEAGWRIGAIYHSHTRTEPYPSQTDINNAARWGDAEWLIVGLASGEPDVRNYAITDGEVREAELEVV